MRAIPDIQLHMGVSDGVVDLIDENADCVVREGRATPACGKACRRSFHGAVCGTYILGECRNALAPQEPGGRTAPHRGLSGIA